MNSSLNIHDNTRSGAAGKRKSSQPASRGKGATGLKGSRVAATAARSNAGRLAFQFLNEWANGKNPTPETYLNQLPNENSKNRFKEAVAMGMLVREALS